MTRLHDTIRALLKERQYCVTRVAEIDQELASVQMVTAEAIASVTPIAPAPVAAAPSPASAKANRRATSTTAAVGPGLIPFEREIRTALVKAPMGSRGVARAIGKPWLAVQTSLKKLAKAGRIMKIGDRGPSCKWGLAGSVSAAVARVRPTAASTDSEFETIFPQPGRPKASPREAIEGARA